MKNAYTSILAELVRRREALAAELDGVDLAIAAISPLASEGESPEESTAPPRTIWQTTSVPAPKLVPPQAPILAAHERYARISVRWAVLWHLAEFAKGPMRNGEIAEAIREGGYRSNAGSFANAVSAVLYGMREKGEIDGTADVGYWVTDKGRQTWALIKQGAKFREATSLPNDHSLLSVQ